MLEAIIFIVRTLLEGLLVTIFLLRVILPLARADARNQLAQAVVRFTNPIVLPLRRVLPPIGKVDTASIVALLVVETAATATLWLLGAYPMVVAGHQFVQIVLLNLVITVLQFYMFALLLYILLSWVAPGTYSPASALVSTLCEPLIRPVRRLIPPIAGLDFSAVFILIAIQAVIIVIHKFYLL